MSARYKRWSRDEGSAMVEFGLISFTFIMLLLGVVEMGRLALVYTAVSNAARAGTRYAIVHGADLTGTGSSGPSGPTSANTSDVQTVVTNYASSGLINTANLTVTVAYPNGTNTAGSPVTVSVQYSYDPLVSFFIPLLRTNLTNTSEGIITF